MLTDFLGMTIPRATFCNPSYANAENHAIRVRQCERLAELPSGARLLTAWPVVAEEYFEYVYVLEAVLQYSREERGTRIAARRPFAFVELGAGYGHWTWTAHQALQQLVPATPHQYLLVDTQTSLGPFVREIARNHSVEQSAVHFHSGKVYRAGRRRLIGWGQDEWLRADRMIVPLLRASPPVTLPPPPPK